MRQRSANVPILKKPATQFPIYRSARAGKLLSLRSSDDRPKASDGGRQKPPVPARLAALLFVALA